MSHPERLLLPIDRGLVPVPTEGPVYFLRAIPAAGLRETFDDRLVFQQTYKPDHDAMLAQGFVSAPMAGGAGLVLVQATRSKEETLGNIALANDHCAPGGIVLVNGDKTDGIDSLLKQVRAVCPVEGNLSKSHGKVFWFAKAAENSIFSQWRQTCEPAELIPGFLTAPGMFSHGRVDPGSAKLAPYITRFAKGRVADLGAGWGYLAAQALAVQAVAHLDLFEAENLSLEAARKNISDERAGFHWCDVTTINSPELPYDVALCNPPFHVSRAADPGLGAQFIAAAARILKPNGVLLMVANRQLPYEGVLDQHFRYWEMLEQDGVYKVFVAQRPRRNA